MKDLTNAFLLLVAAVTVGSLFAHIPQHFGAAHPDRTLKHAFRGIPAGTTLEWDSGKYVPKSVPGYESRADYPDTFWVYDEANLAPAL